LVPLGLEIIYRLAPSLAPLLMLITGLVLLASARVFLETGLGLGLLVLLQLLGSLIATGLLGSNLLSAHDWLRYSANTALMMGYVSFFFNLLGSYLPQ